MKMKVCIPYKKDTRNGHVLIVKWVRIPNGWVYLLCRYHQFPRLLRFRSETLSITELIRYLAVPTLPSGEISTSTSVFSNTIASKRDCPFSLDRGTRRSILPKIP